MRNILAPLNRPVLERFARSRVLLAFDFDGTLAPIVARPDRAAMRRTTRRLLEQLARLYPCVVISGRARRDVSRRLDGVAVRGIVGNHGVEPWRGQDRIAHEVERWRPLLDERLASLRGARIEDKVFSVAVHYRRCRDKRRARALIRRAAASLGEVRVVGGKEVVNLLPVDAPHKGLALERERLRLGCDAAVYVGDDETDEDVFALDRTFRLLGIRVGRRRLSSASYFIESQREMDRLLSALLGLRRVRTDRARARPRT